ncbi:MAG: DUF3343 domain-containing protein [Oscillospiraceae bacterium]|nr:DUF3343 domain-containing protein [Oscillospiraceae bacterium]
MVYYLITCRSLTYAQKAARALERAGITAHIMRTPKGLSKEGCSYSVKVSEQRGPLALRILKDVDARISRVYLQYPTGEYREVPI